MECVRCHSPNEQHRRFCGQCGAPLATICSRCGFVNRVVDRFCGGCGEGLSPDSQAAEWPSARAGQPPPVPMPRQAPASPAAARRAPAPTAAAAASPAPARNGEALSKQDLTELLKPPPAPTAPSLPQKVSQEDLDNLFAK